MPSEPESNVGSPTLKYPLLLSFILTATSLHSYGQQYPRWEAFTGFSYAHVNLGPEAAIFQPTDQNYYGMHLNGSVNPRSYLRILLCDFSVQIGGTTVNVAPEHADVRTSQVLFGPEFSRRSGKTAAFAHTLMGITNAPGVSDWRLRYRARPCKPYQPRPRLRRRARFSSVPDDRISCPSRLYPHAHIRNLGAQYAYEQRSCVDIQLYPKSLSRHRQGR